MKLPQKDVADGGFAPCWSPWTEQQRWPVKAEIPRILVRCARGHVHALHAPAAAAPPNSSWLVECPVRSCGWAETVELESYTPPSAEVSAKARELGPDVPALQYLPPYSVEQLEQMGYVPA